MKTVKTVKTVKTDPILEYYSKRRAKIQDLERKIEQKERDDWGLPSLNRQCEIATLKKELALMREVD